MKAGAWALPVVALAVAAPSAAAASTPTLYKGPAFYIINAGAISGAPANKIYPLSPGGSAQHWVEMSDWRLRPGVRFGMFESSGAVQAVLSFRTTAQTPPSLVAADYFYKSQLNGVVLTLPNGSLSGAPGDYTVTWTVTVSGATAAPNLAPNSGIASLTVLPTAGAVGVYTVTLTNPGTPPPQGTGSFQVTSVTGAGGQILTAQPSYEGRATS